MRLIDADNLRGRVCEIFLCAEPHSAEERRLALVLGLIDSENTITPPPNDPLTFDELQEMAWSQSPVWCSDIDGVHAGLLCIWDEWCTSERTPHIWVLDEEGHSGIYSIQILLKHGSRFYRRKPEKERKDTDG